MEQEVDQEPFTGFEFYLDRNRKLMVSLYQEGRITKLLVPPELERTAPGFYDLDLNPVPDPSPPG